MKDKDDKKPAKIIRANDEAPPLLESTTFDHRRANNPRDHRHLLRTLLAREELSEETIVSVVRNHPKTCKCQYLFSYPSKRRTVKLFPLSRICCLSPSLDLVKLVHESYPEAITGTDEDGRLPLHYACRFEASKSVVDYLIQQYENAVRIQTKEGVLPLHYACRNQDMNIVHDLISLYPESIKVQNKQSWLPLHYACCQQRESHSNMLISYLISLYPDSCKVETKSGSLPLHYAAGGASFQAIKNLVSMYPDGVKTKNRSLRLPLHHACQQKAPIEVINLLVQMYPDSVACSTSMGTTPLIIATENDSPLAVLVYLARVESALDTLNSLPFHARCEILDDMMSEALKETKASGAKEDNMSSQDVTHLGNQVIECDEDDKVSPNTVSATSVLSEEVNESHRSTQATMASSNRTTDPARTAPGAVRIRGPDADEMTNDDDDVSYAVSEAQTTAKELIVASELAPPVAELEAELESYRQRFRNEVVLADEVVAPTETPTHTVDSKCCIIL